MSPEFLILFGASRMRVFLTGGTGSIGRRIVAYLVARGDRAVVLTRNAEKAPDLPGLRGAEFVAGDPSSAGDWQSSVDGCDAVINLVGQNVFGGRWDAEMKRKIRDSRVYGTEHVVAAVARAKTRPSVLVQASATGYYGDRGDEILTEESSSGTDFLAVVCREWEGAAKPASDLGLRVPLIRTGIVLAKGEGALGVMAPIFKWLPGGAAPVGGSGPLSPATGGQWMSWIHHEDILGLFLLGLDHADARGPINAISPNPVTNKEFSRSLAKALHRPFLPIGPPAALLRVVLGEVADVVVSGQRVLPARAEALGYRFRFPELNEALRDVFARARK